MNSIEYVDRLEWECRSNGNEHVDKSVGMRAGWGKITEVSRGFKHLLFDSAQHCIAVYPIDDTVTAKLTNDLELMARKYRSMGIRVLKKDVPGRKEFLIAGKLADLRNEIGKNEPGLAPILKSLAAPGSNLLEQLAASVVEAKKAKLTALKR